MQLSDSAIGVGPNSISKKPIVKSTFTTEGSRVATSSSATCERCSLDSRHHSEAIIATLVAISR